MSLIKSIRSQLGLSSTATQNFTLDASAADGSMKLARGNAGATTQDIITVDASGNVNAPVGLQLGGISAGRMLLLTAKATTSGTFIDFSPSDGTGIPSWAKRVTLMFNGVSLSGVASLVLQIGAGSVDATGYSGDSQSGASSSGGTTYFVLSPLNSAANAFSGAVELISMGSNTWVLRSELAVPSSSVSVAAGVKALSGTLDRVRVTSSNGTDTFDLGSVAVLCEG